MRFAFLPLVGVLSALTGCAYDIVECTPDQRAYIDDTKTWIHENADLIDARMEEKWPRSRGASMEDVLAALDTANIQCGIENHEADGVAASHMDPGNRIVIDIHSQYFIEAFSHYKRHRWTAAYTMAELDDPDEPTIDREKHPSPFNENLTYVTSLGEMGLLLVHEAAHEVLGDHSPEAEERRAIIDGRTSEGEVDAFDLRRVDEIYALGWWTLDASQIVWSEAMDELIASYWTE